MYVCLILGVPESEIDATYLMYVENSKPGIMKRSGMTVELNSPLQNLPMYNVSKVDIVYFVIRTL